MPEVLQIKISLDRTNPLIWRDILVKKNISFYRLHQIIQLTMGWTNSHLFEFSIEGYSIGEIYEDLEMLGTSDILNARETFLKDLLDEKGEEFKYTYDFGDNWVHTIRVSQYDMEKQPQQVPVCTAGAFQCPPEDCGSISGYYDLIKVLSDKKHPEYKDTKIWVGNKFDSLKFDLIKINNKLKNINRSFK